MRALLIENRRRVSRVAQKRRGRVLSFSVLFLVMALSFITLLAQLSHKEEFLIRKVEVEGSALVSRTQLVASVNHLLKGSYLGLFPRSNSLLLSRNSLEENLLKEYPALDSVSIKRTSFSGLFVLVREREPSVLWCERDSQSPSGFSSCYFVDRDGYIFAEAPDISSDAYLRFVGYTASSTVGTVLFSADRYKEFSFFLQSLRELGLSPRNVFIEEGTAGIPDFSIEITSGAKLLISGSYNLEQTLANISAFFSDPEISTSSARFLEKVAYVDFRFGSKVFYKLRGE